MWINFFKQAIEQSAHMASLYSTCEYFSWTEYFYSESGIRTILIMQGTMKENAYWTMNTFQFADSVWDKTWSSVELIQQQPQKLLTFPTVFTIFMIYRLRPGSAAPPSYVTSLASVEGQDIFNISCHLFFPSGWKWGRRGIFASRHWRLILLILQQAAFLRSYQILKPRWHDQQESLLSRGLPMSSASIHILWWSFSSSKKTKKPVSAIVFHFVAICKANWCPGVFSGNGLNQQKNTVSTKDGNRVILFLLSWRC